ncbi:MAG: hypothetical protein FJ034_04465 [Chloroflexi bacterium]|nr:hypothetical protein [Chloroflexota bacterium]
MLVYQLIDNDIRLGTNDRTRPFYPYLTLAGPDRRMIYRLPAQTTNSVVLVNDGQTVDVGDALFRVVGTGPTSWNAFYDSTMQAQVLVSLAAVPSGRELDPAPLFR